ncbi:hypothetical protein Tco_0157495 [Tanacetum coccineum]
MPRAIVGNTSLTRSYIPKVSQTPGISLTIANFYKPIEDRCIHEGRVVDQFYYTSNHIDRCFSNIRLNCLYEINEPIVPRFILDFNSQVTLQRDDSGFILISFKIQNEFITLPLAQFGQILIIPYNGQAVFTNEWDLSSLAFFQETEGPYHTNLPTLEEINQFLQFHRVESNRTIKVMRPLALRQTCKPRNNHGIHKARYSVSSSFIHHYESSSHQEDDDDNEGISRASTPSPTTYLNSLSPLNYEKYDIPTSFE